MKNLVLQLLSKMFSTNHIAVFFNHQYLWKESINTLDFLHGASHQAKVASGKKNILLPCDNLTHFRMKFIFIPPENIPFQANVLFLYPLKLFEIIPIFAVNLIKHLQFFHISKS